MDDKTVKQFQSLIEETVLRAVQSTKQENSGLMHEVKETMIGIKSDSNHFRENLAEIKELAKKTNGRVTRLEMWKENHVGKISVISVVVSFVVSSILIPIVLSLTK